MELHGISFDVKNKPILDETFVPLALFNSAYLKGATKPLKIAVERNSGLVSVHDTKIYGTDEMKEADKFYVERTVKFLLWGKGGYKVTICGDDEIGAYIKEVYSANGARSFDFDFMGRVFQNDFVVETCNYEDAPSEKENPTPVGRHLDGCRIGFDAGGSDRKVSAVVDGEAIYSEEVVWHPKTNEDPEYHYSGIVDAFKTAASKMPRVDAIGVSSAGIYIDNLTMAASLFIKVPKDAFDKHVKDIYIRAAKEIGDVPLVVANDGDVTALAGAMALEENGVLGIAMGTSEAVGFVDNNGNITGWLNELAFAPVDGQEEGTVDEWSGDKGVGAKYFSQDAVIKLAEKGGITLEQGLSPAACLKVVQQELNDGKKGAEQIFETIGCYLGHTLAFYSTYYDMKHVLLLGRVMSGKGGDIVLAEAKRVLADEYKDVCEKLNVMLPDEKSRRVGQSVAAASLPSLG